MLCDPFTVSPFRMNPSVIPPEAPAPPLAGDLPLAEKIIRSQLKIPLKAGMRYNRNVEVAKKVFLFCPAFKYRNISLACQKLGYRRSYLLTQNSGFYFWFNRLKEADFDISSLEKRSTQMGARMGRRPLSYPQKTPQEIVDSP